MGARRSNPTDQHKLAKSKTPGTGVLMGAGSGWAAFQERGSREATAKKIQGTSTPRARGRAEAEARARCQRVAARATERE